MRTVFVTGGSGFVGRHLIEAERRVLDASSPSFETIVITVEEGLRQLG